MLRVTDDRLIMEKMSGLNCAQICAATHRSFLLLLATGTQYNGHIIHAHIPFCSTIMSSLMKATHDIISYHGLDEDENIQSKEGKYKKVILSDIEDKQTNNKQTTILKTDDVTFWSTLSTLCHTASHVYENTHTCS